MSAADLEAEANTLCDQLLNMDARLVTDQGCPLCLTPTERTCVERYIEGLRFKAIELRSQEAKPQACIDKLALVPPFTPPPPL